MLQHFENHHLGSDFQNAVTFLFLRVMSWDSQRLIMRSKRSFPGSFFSAVDIVGIHVATFFFNGAETYEKSRFFWHGPTVLLSDKDVTQLLQTALKRCRTFTLRRKCVEHVYPAQIRCCAVSGYPQYHSEVQ